MHASQTEETDKKYTGHREIDAPKWRWWLQRISVRGEGHLTSVSEGPKRRKDYIGLFYVGHLRQTCRFLDMLINTKNLIF